MKNIFKISKRGIIAIFTLCILFCTVGNGVHAAIEEDTTAVAAVETTQELMPMMANRCSNGRPGSPVKCTGSWLSNNGIDDPKAFKRNYTSDGSLFDIYRDKSNNNALWLGNKSQTIWIPCL